MDFDFDESEQALVDLVSQIVSDQVDHVSLKALEADGQTIDHDTWAALAEAGVLGALVPEADGGAGLGAVALAGACEVAGHHAAMTPFWPSAVAMQTIAAFGDDAQRSSLLPGLIDGSTVATVALAPAVVEATETSDGWVLNGTSPFVPIGMSADLALVTSVDDAFVVDLSADGVDRTAVPVTTGRDEANVTFADTPAERMGDGASAWAAQRADLAICALMAGHCDAAMRLMADYTQQRQQFDRAIATFQAVTQRAGDIYIDTGAARLTMLQAGWRLDAGLDATEALAVARWWAAEAGDRVTSGSVHLHGGVGVDRDYPVHRHYLAARQLELTLGPAEAQLERLGAAIAAS